MLKLNWKRQGTLYAIWQLQQRWRLQSDTVVVAVAGSRPRCVVCYMAASAKKTLARNLTLSLQSLAHVQGASSAIWQLHQKRRSLAIWHCRCSRWLTSKVRRLLYGSFSNKTLARNLTLSLQSLAHVQGALSALWQLQQKRRSLAIWHCVAVAGSRRRSRRLLYGSFSKKDARSQSDTVVAVTGSRWRRLLYGSFSKKDARNLAPSSQSFVGCNSELNAVVAMIKWCGDKVVS